MASSDNLKLLGVAAGAAAAASLLTYAVIRRQCDSPAAQPGGCGQEQASTSGRVEQAEPTNGALAKRDPFDPSSRTDYLSWDDYFMAVAFLSSQRSKDPNKQVGACIVDTSCVICGIGYNGFPRGCPDGRLPWAKSSTRGDPLETKYPYVCHAEMNAILNKNGASVAGCRVYVTMFPCNECAKLLIQAGIREIVYHEGKNTPQPRPESPSQGGFKRDQQYAASRKLLDMAGVKVRQHLFAAPVFLRLTNDARRPVEVLQQQPAQQAAAAAAPPAALTSGGSAAAVAGEQVQSEPAAEQPPIASAIAAVLEAGCVSLLPGQANGSAVTSPAVNAAPQLLPS